MTNKLAVIINTPAMVEQQLRLLLVNAIKYCALRGNKMLVVFNILFCSVHSLKILWHWRIKQSRSFKSINQSKKLDPDLQPFNLGEASFDSAYNYTTDWLASLAYP